MIPQQPGLYRIAPVSYANRKSLQRYRPSRGSQPGGSTPNTGPARTRWVRCTAAALLLPAQLLLGQTQDRWDPVRGAIRRHMQEHSIAAISVAVAKDGKILWEEGFGWANREKMIPATPETMYSLASISKPFTATGLMVLAGRKAVDLDRPINDYLGVGKLTGLAGDAAGATVRRVLSHTSGLPLHYQFFYADKGYAPPTMDETISRYGVLVTAPGTVYTYSNLGFGIIDHVISRASGQEYASFMRNEVFLPLGLTHTSVGIGTGLEAYAAERYDQHERPVPFYTFDHLGASAVYSSAHDLVRFGMFHLKAHLADQRAIIADSLIDLMHKPSGPEPFAKNYGLGWGVSTRFGYASSGHTGGMPGVRTILTTYPTEHVAIVVLTNSEAGWGPIAEDIAGVLLPRYADSLSVTRAKPPETPKPKEFVPPQELVGTWSGTVRTWKSTLPLTLEIRTGQDVRVQIGNAPANDFDRGDTQLPTILSRPGYENGRLTGRFGGQITTEDASRWPHTIGLDVHLVNGMLRGTVSAQTGANPVYFSLASYVELKKQ